MPRYVISGIDDKSGIRIELFSVNADNPTVAVAKALAKMTEEWRKKLRRGSLLARQAS